MERMAAGRAAQTEGSTPSSSSSSCTFTASIEIVTSLKRRHVDVSPNGGLADEPHTPLYTQTQTLAMEFTSNQEGAKSLDIKGQFRPKQIFSEKEFHLLEFPVDPLSRGLYQLQMYLIELHGGKVVGILEIQPNRTILVAPFGGNLTGPAPPKFTIYTTSLILEHVKRGEYLSDESMKNYIWRGPLNDLNEGKVVVKLEKTGKEKVVSNNSDIDVVDLTLDDENEAVENIPLKQEPDDFEPMSEDQVNLAVPPAEPISTEASKINGSIEESIEVEAIEISGMVENPSGGMFVETGKPGPSNGEKMQTSTNDDLSAVTNSGMPTDSIAVSTGSQDTGVSSNLESSVGAGQSCSQKITWTEEDKELANVLAFRFCKGAHNAAQIYQNTAKEFEKIKLTPIPTQTIRSQISKLASNKKKSRQMFDSLQVKYNLDEEMWTGFLKYFIKEPPFSITGHDGTRKPDEAALKGIAAIDEFVAKKT